MTLSVIIPILSTLLYTYSHNLETNEYPLQTIITLDLLNYHHSLTITLHKSMNKNQKNSFFGCLIFVFATKSIFY